jgi:hypothetical protein
MATPAQRLEEARAARHKLATGQLARVFVDQNGERVEFLATNLAQLDAYIRGLEGEANPAIRAMRPIGFIF